MKRKPTEFTVTGLAAHLHKSRRATLALIAQAGIQLAPVEIHYTDTAPRSRRNWRKLTSKEADAVIAMVRARQGAKVVRPGPAPRS